MRKGMHGTLAALVAALVMLIAGPTAANAAVQITGMTATPSTTQAGAHADFHVHLDFAGTDQPKSLVLHLPAGLIGNPSAATACSVADFQNNACTSAAQVGTSSIAAVTKTRGLFPVTTNITASGQIYVLQPGADQTALLGIKLTPDFPANFLSPTPIDNTSVVKVRDTTDSGLDSVLDNLPNTAETSLLGTADVQLTSLDLTLDAAGPNGSFETNPTTCGVTTTSVDITSYQDPAAVSRSASYTSTGCANVPLDPTVQVIPETTKRSSNAGFTIKIGVPAGDSAAGIRQSHISRTAVKLPLGVGLNPGLAASVSACTDAQFGLGSHAQPTCPAGSQIGTVKLDTPVVAGTLNGTVYLGAPTPDTMLRVFVLVNGPGFVVKLTGSNQIDPATGQVTAVFDGLPQIPFTNFEFAFTGGEKSVLTTPSTCGPAQTVATLTPFSGNADVTATSTFTVDADGAGGACGATPFAPFVGLDVAPTQAGSNAVTSVTLARHDGDQLLKDVVVHMPPGLAGSLKGVPFCPDAQATAGTCDASTQVGTVHAEAGVGSQPLQIDGKVYLVGPGDGFLARLAIVLPGNVGPFDFGNVVSFAGLGIRTSDAGLDVTTRNLPTTLDGIPLNLRSIRLSLDRPGFARNATACAAGQLTADFTSTDGATAGAAAPYQATGCANEKYAPQIVGTATGSTAKSGRPALTIGVVQPDGESASKKVTITLPKTVAFGSLGSNRVVCTQAQLDAKACPAASQIGTALVETPLLPIPLTGPVYFVTVKGQAFPALSITLAPLGLTLTGSTAIVGGRLVNTFDNLPDTPLTKFQLALNGGKAGIITSTANLCTSTSTFNGAFSGQSGKSTTTTATLAVAGCQPKVAATMRKAGSKRFTFALQAKAPSGGAKLSKVRFSLPKGVSIKRLATTRETRAPKTEKIKKVGRSTIQITAPKGGAASLKVTFKAGALSATKKARRTFTATVTDVKGKKTALKKLVATKK